MKYSIFFKTDHEYFVFKTSGKFSVEDHSRLLRELVSHTEWRKGMNLIADHSDAGFEGVSVDDIEEVCQSVIVADEKYGAGRCAVIIPPEGFSIAEIYKFRTELSLSMKIKIFQASEYDDALSWLIEEN